MGTFGQPGFPQSSNLQKEWRHLDRATRNPQWPHTGNPVPSAQVLVGQHLVKTLNNMGIKCRLGGSVAALGYLSTRHPDDIDIDILPAHRHIDEAEKELQNASLRLQALTGATIKGTDSTTWTNFQIRSVTPDLSTKFVKGLILVVQIVRNEHNESTYVIRTLHESVVTLKVQLINETAFTFMNLVKDAGDVDVETYKEVAGFSRLVANSLGRLIQNGIFDSKNDRARVKEMLRAKVISYQQQPTKVFYVRCSKILNYFNTYEDARRAAVIIGALVAELDPTTNATQFEEAVYNSFVVSKALKTFSAFFPGANVTT